MSIINFTHNKSIEVIFDTEEEETYILADIDFIEIIYTGCGIPGNKLDKLFNGFKRFDNNLSHEEGTTIRIVFDKQSKKEEQITDTYNDMPRRVALELSDI